jgi:(E)-4-hydroxy-3-methylbut-2-enyl-diphosphate synthase
VKIDTLASGRVDALLACAVGSERAVRFETVVDYNSPAAVVRPDRRSGNSATAGNSNERHSIRSHHFAQEESRTMESVAKIQRNPTRSVRIGSISIGAEHPIAVQSMTATHTQDIDATVRQVRDLERAGADVVRIAVDSKKDVDALAEIRRQTSANLVVDLQENYRLAELVAPHVHKLRYNPGHLYHHERTKPWQDKVRYLAQIAIDHDLAMRVGVNCGSVDPDKKDKYDPSDSISPMLESAWEHCQLLDDLGFHRFCVSLKDSDPKKVIEVNRRFAEQRPDVPLHLGVTEAGMPPDGIIKTRIAFEQLISRGIGDTIRVSLTVSNDRKGEEIAAGRQILEDIAAGRVRSVVDYGLKTLNIISCPSCSRVENEAFIDLAVKVKEMTQYAQAYDITIAVMGCRVNGPGETDDADLGLWCGPNHVNLKRGPIELGAFKYDEILPRLKAELDQLMATREPVSAA